MSYYNNFCWELTQNWCLGICQNRASIWRNQALIFVQFWEFRFCNNRASIWRNRASILSWRIKLKRIFSTGLFQILRVLFLYKYKPCIKCTPWDSGGCKQGFRNKQQTRVCIEFAIGNKHYGWDWLIHLGKHY